MKILLKNIVIFALLFAVSAPIIISFMSYSIQLRKIKKEVKNDLIFSTPRSELVNFEFDMNGSEFKSLRWVHSHEFELNELMFDIVEADTIGNMVYYLCFPDKQETALNKEFKDLLNARYATDLPAHKRQRLISNFIKSLYLPENFQFFDDFDFKPLKVFRDYVFSYETICLEAQTPPPKFI